MEEENSCGGSNLIFQISITVPKFWNLGFYLLLLKSSDIFIIIFIYFRYSDNKEEEVGFKLKKYDTIKDVIISKLSFEPIKSTTSMSHLPFLYALSTNCVR